MYLVLEILVCLFIIFGFQGYILKTSPLDYRNKSCYKQLGRHRYNLIQIELGSDMIRSVLVEFVSDKSRTGWNIVGADKTRAW